MRATIKIAFVALITLIVAAFGALPANAQQLAAVPADIAGEWYGVIEGYELQTWLEPRRKLVIDASGCTWQEVGKDASPSHCTVNAKGLALTTGARSAVNLRLNGAMLTGTFKLADGREFKMSMHRTPDQATGWTVATAAVSQFDPKQFPSMPTLHQIPNPRLSFEQVRERCLQYFASAEYSGTIVAEGAWAREQVRMSRYTLRFSTDGKPSETWLADGRPTCAVWQSTQNWAAYPEKAPVRVHFDGVHLIRHTKENRGSIHIVKSDGSLNYLDFFAYSDTSDLATIRKRWGTLTR